MVTDPAATQRTSPPRTSRRLIETLGGRFSHELGIDLDAGGAADDEWFLAATLFGTRISAEIAIRTYLVLADAGVRTVTEALRPSYDDLVALLDAGGYARYDFRTATRLQELAHAVGQRFGGSVSALALVSDPRAVETALDALPGWGPTTVRIFLRELRDIWPGAQPDLDDRTLAAARHLDLPVADARVEPVETLRTVAGQAHLDVRDLEAALVRLALAHRDRSTCPGGWRCRVLADRTFRKKQGPSSYGRRTDRATSR